MTPKLLTPLLLIPLVLAGCADATAEGQPPAPPGPATDTVQVYPPIANRENIQRKLLTMDMPAMCGHQPGQLVDGKLPQEFLKDGRGQVSVLTMESDTLAGQVVVLNVEMTGEGSPEYVVQVTCDQGGVAWPAQLMLLDSDFNVLVPALKLPAEPEQARGTFEDINVRGGQLYLKYRALGPNDAAAAPSLMVEGLFRAEGDQLVPVE